MKVLPILFNTDMVQAILDGRKTVTRRLVKEQHLKVLKSQYHKEHSEVSAKALLEKLCEPPYRPGDVLYVRETWAEWTGGYVYKAGTPPFAQPGEGSVMSWRPSIHMPKEAARIWLKVTDVRVERLQDITERGAEKEGAIDNRGFIHSPDNEYNHIHTTIEHFKNIWDSTIKKSYLKRYGWEANPYVWVIEFEGCEKPKE